MNILNLEKTEIAGQVFLAFDVVMSGHLIASVYAPMLEDRIIWERAAIYGFSAFAPVERASLQEEVDRKLTF